MMMMMKIAFHINSVLLFFFEKNFIFLFNLDTKNKFQRNGLEREREREDEDQFTAII